MFRVTVRLTGTLITGGGINRMYFLESGGTASQAATAAGTFWNAIRPIMSDQVTWTVDNVVDQMNEATGDITAQQTVTGSTFSGQSAAAIQPKATQGLLQLRTGIFSGGREIRGRIFIPGVTSTAVVGGVPTASYIASLKTAGDALVADASSTFGVWSKAHGLIGAVQTTAGGPKFAVLRSRRD